MAIESSLAILRNRKTHVAVEEIKDWTGLRFRQERYKAAMGSLDFSRGAVSDKAVQPDEIWRLRGLDLRDP